MRSFDKATNSRNAMRATFQSVDAASSSDSSGLCNELLEFVVLNANAVFENLRNDQDDFRSLFENVLHRVIFDDHGDQLDDF